VIRVGPAGWSYPDWEGRVYPAAHPPGFHPLSFLSRYFDTIEINSSFYALPRAEHAQRWTRLVAERPDFRFLVKLNREFTHDTGSGAGVGGTQELANEFRAGIQPLARANRLGAVLAQFPAGFQFGAEEVRHERREPVPVRRDVVYKTTTDGALLMDLYYPPGATLETPVPLVVIVLGLGAAVAAWLSTGTKRIAYVGWQMGIAIFMTILQKPHPVTELDVIWDRFVGIVVGVVAIRLAFAFPSITFRSESSDLDADELDVDADQGKAP
jgi:hypothetical protein